MNEQIEAAISRDRSGKFMVRMAEAIGARAGARSVFAEPVRQNGATVVPVAQALWGFGGGTGGKRRENAPVELGTGGGGGAVVRPVGYIVLHDGKVSYHRITAVPTLLLAALAGAALAVLLRRWV